MTFRSRFTSILGARLTLLAASMPTPADAAPSSHLTDSNQSRAVAGSSRLPSVPDDLRGHRHARACAPTPAPRASCAAVEDLNVSGADPETTAVPHGYGPADLRAAYRLPTAPSDSAPTVAIVAAFDSANAQSDLNVYRARFGLPPCGAACFRKVDQRGGETRPVTESGWTREIALDLDMVSAACPNCHILLVEADSDQLSDLGMAVDTAVLLGAVSVSNSYGTAESAQTSGFDIHFNHPGVAITASAGDNGYGVSYPASSPYVIAVGGTSLRPNATGPGWSESAWGGTGSGCSLFESKPAWQHDSGCSRRTVADISAVADPSTGVAVYDSGTSDGTTGWVVVGGTSASAPLIAGMYALTGAPRAGANPAQFAYASGIGLHDVDSGSNGSCAPVYLCNAGAGYDGPSGQGAPRGLTIFATPIPPPVPTPCSDVPSGMLFHDEITWLLSSGIATGYGDGTYRPRQLVTRDAMAAFLYRLAGNPPYTPPKVSPFSDVPTGSMFYKEITWLASVHVTTGYPNGSFHPLDSVNRDAMAAFLYRFAGSPSYGPSPTPVFTDVRPTDPFYREISWLYRTGITTGYPGNEFRPLQAVYRDAMAAFLSRYNGAFPP